jgi:hypothetical protein
MNKISIMLEEDALIDLHEVLLDDSADGALAFVKKHIAPQIPAKGTALCDSSRLNPFILPEKRGASRRD